MSKFYFEHCRWRKNSALWWQLKCCDINTQNNNVIKHSLSHDDAEQSLNIKKNVLILQTEQGFFVCVLVVTTFKSAVGLQMVKTKFRVSYLAFSLFFF